MVAPTKLALVFGLIAAAAAAGFAVSQKRLGKLPRARQSEDASLDGWLEDSAAHNQTRIKILQSTPERLDIAYECRPGSSGAFEDRECAPPQHRHETVTEYLTIRKGVLGYVIDGKRSTQDTGTITIPPNTRHTWWNEKPGEQLEMIFTFAPRGEYERFFRTIYGLGHDYGSFTQVPLPQWFVTFNAAGMPHADAPDWAWKSLVKHIVVPAAKASGFRAFEDEYARPAVKSQ